MSLTITIRKVFQAASIPKRKGQFSSSIPPQQIAAVSKVMCVRIKNCKYKKTQIFLLSAGKMTFLRIFAPVKITNTMV